MMTYLEMQQAAEAAQAVATIIALCLGGWWTYSRFVRQREDHPHIEFSVEIKFVRKVSEWWVVELIAWLENKGKVQHRIESFEFDLAGLFPKDPVQLSKEWGNQLHFPQEIAKGSWMPQGWRDTFIDPGIRAHYSFVTRVPADALVLLMHAWFRYPNRKEQHSAEITVAVPTTLDTHPVGSRNDDDGAGDGVYRQGDGEVRPVALPNLKLALDSNILSYLLQATSGTYDPATDTDDNLRPERVASFRLFLYGPQFWVTAAVIQEVTKIQNVSVRELHQSWIWTLLGELREDNLNQGDVAQRQARYEALHPVGKMDCRAVAEAESDAGLDRFLTFDRTLLKNLAGKTERIVIQKPSDCWESLAIPKGTPPRWSPAPSNPLSAVDWWRW
jgi:hypothetical protein